MISRLGVKYPLKEEHKLPLFIHDDVGDIPMTFDSRTKWPQCKTISLIRDQAACGSCWVSNFVHMLNIMFQFI